jgi:hypothetical protein
MRTAMQLMVWYLENEGLEESGAYYKAIMLLEKEKEQIIEAFKTGYNVTEYDADEYFDLIYNQNK